MPIACPMDGMTKAERVFLQLFDLLTMTERRVLVSLQISEDVINQHLYTQNPCL